MSPIRPQSTPDSKTTTDALNRHMSAALKQDITPQNQAHAQMVCDQFAQAEDQSPWLRARVRENKTGIDALIGTVAQGVHPRQLMGRLQTLAKAKTHSAEAYRLRYAQIRQALDLHAYAREVLGYAPSDLAESETSSESDLAQVAEPVTAIMAKLQDDLTQLQGFGPEVDESEIQAKRAEIEDDLRQLHAQESEQNVHQELQQAAEPLKRQAMQALHGDLTSSIDENSETASNTSYVRDHTDALSTSPPLSPRR